MHSVPFIHTRTLIGNLQMIKIFCFLSAEL